MQSKNKEYAQNDYSPIQKMIKKKLEYHEKSRERL